MRPGLQWRCAALETNFLGIAFTTDKKPKQRVSQPSVKFLLLNKVAGYFAIAPKNVHGFRSHAKGTLPLIRKIILEHKHTLQLEQ